MAVGPESIWTAGRLRWCIGADFIGKIYLLLWPHADHRPALDVVGDRGVHWATRTSKYGKDDVTESVAVDGTRSLPTSIARLRWQWWLVSALLTGLGLLTKGPVALVLTLVPVVAFSA